MVAPGPSVSNPAAEQCSDRPNPTADTLAQSPHACRQCSRLKRKCQRELPSCSMCTRLGKACEYPAGRKPYGSRSSNTSASPQAIEGNTAAPSFPDTFFIDTDLFQPVSHSALTSPCSIPAHIVQLLGSELKITTDYYFCTTDKWFPFISRKRVAQCIQARIPTESPGFTLLLLCMKLATESPRQYGAPATSTVLYKTVKNYLNTIEEVSPTSLHLLQALVLIAVYEIGHGIFPAAYLTVGRAARLGILRGVHDRNNATQLFRTPPSWTYWEEERRTWWAVVILERCINIGPTGLPLAIPEPSQSDLLPTTDDEWQRGEIGTNQALFTTGFSPDSQIGPFARVCQTSHALGRVINHRNHAKSPQAREAVLAEALQLDSTLTALDGYLALHSSNTKNGTTLDIGVCICARLALSHMYACNIPDGKEQRLLAETDMQAACISGLKQIMSVRGAALARCVLAQAAQNIDQTSPLVIQSLYDVATECQWFLREGDILEGTSETLQLLMEALTLLSDRWEVAGKCLVLLHEADS